MNATPYIQNPIPYALPPEPYPLRPKPYAAAQVFQSDCDITEGTCQNTVAGAP
uniref:Uncharacterized protein n=1 Tax=Anguilla anguilla TaxID=7936 RepID=A0A0E9Q4X1_ANGAN